MNKLHKQRGAKHICRDHAAGKSPRTKNDNNYHNNCMCEEKKATVRQNAIIQWTPACIFCAHLQKMVWCDEKLLSKRQKIRAKKERSGHIPLAWWTPTHTLRHTRIREPKLIIIIIKLRKSFFRQANVAMCASSTLQMTILHHISIFAVWCAMKK